MKLPQAIVCTDPDRASQARKLADKYELPLLDKTQGQLFNGLMLVLGERIQLHNPQIGAPLEINFNSPAVLNRLTASSKQPISRACGLHKTRELKILDCTAGMGQDMLTLAAASAKVTPVEQQEFIHLLLLDAFQQKNDSALLQKALANCELPALGDAYRFLQEHPNANWDVIYLDPMFSGYKRKALPKKAMQLFSDICGESQEPEALFTLALGRATRRVVVKRGALAPYMAGLEPDHQIKGKSLRFDVYMAEK